MSNRAVKRAVQLAMAAFAAAALTGFLADSNLVLVQRWQDHPWVFTFVAIALGAVLEERFDAARWLRQPLMAGLLCLLLVLGGFSLWGTPWIARERCLSQPHLPTGMKPSFSAAASRSNGNRSPSGKGTDCWRINTPFDVTSLRCAAFGGRTKHI